MTTVITTHELTRCFGEITAVNELTFEINQGEVVGFLGHNGAGKTTTVRLLNGLLTPTRGNIKVLGYDPVKDGPALRKSTGVLTENPALDDKLTAREYLAIFGRLYNLSKIEIENRSITLLDSFDLLDRADDRTGTYSKGMRQRLALARALLHNPPLLFLDEPTNGLDPVATRQVHQTITELSRENKHTIFLCTHNLIEAQLLCDKVAVLEQGRLIAFGPPQTLAKNLARGVKVEISFDLSHTGESIQTIQSVIKMKSVIDAEDALTVWLASRNDIPDLVNTLVSNSFRIMRVNAQEPTLEDVYFALHDNSNKNQLEDAG
jgi:ABC-2 type transport system ATP-binding protein